MKKAFVIFAAGLLAACSSSNNSGGGSAPTPTTYSYSGTPTQPTTTQTGAATTAQSDTQSVVSAATQGTVTNNADGLSTAPQLPDDVVAGLQAVVALPKRPSSEMVAKLMRATKSGEIETGCYTVSGNTLSYNNCNLSGSGYSLTISGTLTATPTNITWSVTANYTFTDSSDNFVETGNWTGNLNLTGDGNNGSISGQANSGWTVTGSSSGTNFDFAYTAQVLFNALTYSSDCTTGDFFVGGSMDVSVTVTDSSFTGGYENFGIQYDFSGCGTVTVITGTAT